MPKNTGWVNAFDSQRKDPSFIVKDTSLVSITMKDGSFLGIEVAWSMCLQDDVFKSVLQEERYYFPDGNMNFCTS